MGSSWVHGTKDNPIMNFVNEFSLKYVGGDFDDVNTSFIFTQWNKNARLCQGSSCKSMGHI